MKKNILLQALLLIIFAAFISFPFMRPADTAKMYDPQMDPVPVAVVFTGNWIRLKSATELYLNGKVEDLLIVGNDLVAQNMNELVSSFQISCWEQGNCKQPNIGRIEILEANNTNDSTRLAIPWVKLKNPVDLKAIIVTSDYHMARTLQLMRNNNKGDRLTLYRYEVTGGRRFGIGFIEGVKKVLTFYGFGGITGRQMPL